MYAADKRTTHCGATCSVLWVINFIERQCHFSYCKLAFNFRPKQPFHTDTYSSTPSFGITMVFECWFLRPYIKPCFHFGFVIIQIETNQRTYILIYFTIPNVQ